MKMNIGMLACGLGLALCCAAGAFAAGYPERPVRVVVPFSTGGGTDIIARVLSERLTESLGKSFVVENRPGGGAMIGADLVAKSASDGYVILVGTSAELTIAPAMFGKSPYNPVADFWPVALLGTSPAILLAHPAFPGNTLGEFIKLAKASPGKITVASGGTGTAPHLAGELLKTLAGINIIIVPYKGAGPSNVDLVGGQVDLAYSTIASAAPFIKSKRVKAIAVISAKRSPLLPDVQSAAEQGVANYEAVTWFGLFVPAQTPREVVDTLRKAVDRALREKDFQNRLDNLGIDAGSVEQGGEALQNRIRTELARWTKVVKDAGIKAE